MKLALISDLHGNEIALDAVLEDIERAGIDQVFCLGDVATLGPRPSGVIQRLRDLGCPCILGNHDAFLLNPGLIHEYTEAAEVVEAVDWCRDQLSEDELDFLRGFEPSIEVPLDGGSSLLLFHGSPASHMEDLLSTTPAEEIDRMLAGHDTAVVAGGHTHIQMLRQHRGRLIVNPGSLGIPFTEFVAGGSPTVAWGHAEYATVESSNGSVSVGLHRVRLDRGALRDAALDCDDPVRALLLEHYS